MFPLLTFIAMSGAYFLPPLPDADALTDTTAVFVAPLNVALTGKAVVFVTVGAVKVNVPTVAPAATVTEAGSVARFAPDNAIIRPPVGAAEPSVTVPVTVLPPAIAAVGKANRVSTGANKFNAAVFVTLL